MLCDVLRRAKTLNACRLRLAALPAALCLLAACNGSNGDSPSGVISSSGDQSSSTSSSSSGSSSSTSSGSSSSGSSSSASSSSASSSSASSSSSSSSSSTSSSGGSSSGGSSSGGSSSGSSSSGSSSGAAGLWPPAVVPTPTSCVSTPLTGSHATYNVGPGQTYSNLTAVPWLSLQPGDVVNIYFQPTPYATKIAIQAVGTAAQPIIINGVTDANCNRPVITGAYAVESTDSISSGFWATSAGSTVEPLGVVVFLWGPSQPYATLQSYITLQNIEVTGGKSVNTFTNHNGQVVNYYSGGPSGIYAVAAQYITVQYCTVTGNDQGIFFNSQDSQRTSYYITLRGNDIYANGQIGNELDHNIYVQGVRSLYEGNYIGTEISGAMGSSLKDRSSGTVIRNNHIEASLRAIDLVDTQVSPQVLSDPLYNYAWVYGNVIVDNYSNGIGSGDLIHWGGDSQGDQASSPNYRNGPLFFYFNTVIIENDPSYERDGIFDMPSSLQSVHASNNIFYFTGNNPNTQVELGLCCGTVNLDDTNWISTGWYSSVEIGNTVAVNQNGTLIQGANPQLNADFMLSTASGSPVIGKGTITPTSVPNTAVDLQNLQVTAEYATQSQIVARPNDQDLGAHAAR